MKSEAKSWYNKLVHHWSTDETKSKKFGKNYKFWRLTQLINYGLAENERLDRKELISAWPNIKDNLDPYKKRLLEFLLWGKQYSLPNNLNFYNSLPKTSK